MFVVHGCCPSCDLFEVHYSFSICSELSSLLLLFLCLSSQWIIPIWFVLHFYWVQIVPSVNARVDSTSLAVGILLLSARVANLHTSTLRKGRVSWPALDDAVNHSCQRDICQIIFQITRLGPFELFEPIRKIIVLEELWKNLKKQEIDLFMLCGYIILKQNSYFLYFIFICFSLELLKFLLCFKGVFLINFSRLIPFSKFLLFFACLKYNSIDNKFWAQLIRDAICVYFYKILLFFHIWLIPRCEKSQR